MHQYIREQADALAQKRLGEYQQMRKSAKCEPPRQMLTHQEPLHRGGETYKQGTLPGQKLLTKEFKARETQSKLG